MESAGRGHQRGILDAHAVVHLVALLQVPRRIEIVSSTEGSPDEDRLEPPLEGRVLLDVLAVLVERRRADTVQLAARERRLQHVRGVRRALGRAGTDDRVQLVDEEDDAALGLGDLSQHRLQPILELAAILGAGDQCADVERDQAPLLQRLGNVARR